MSALAAMQPWLELQGQTLARLHPQRLPQLPAGLVLLARERPAGRRWLAWRLAQQPLFSALPDEASATALRNSAWLEPLLRQPDGLLLELGARALAPALRTVVDRAGVRCLREVLGAARYQRALDAAAETVLPEKLMLAFQAAVSDESALGDLLRACGARELVAAAAAVHPAWGESAGLSLADWSEAAPGAALLPPALAAALLHEAASE